MAFAGLFLHIRRIFSLNQRRVRSEFSNFADPARGEVHISLDSTEPAVGSVGFEVGKVLVAPRTFSVFVNHVAKEFVVSVEFGCIEGASASPKVADLCDCVSSESFLRVNSG